MSIQCTCAQVLCKHFRRHENHKMLKGKNDELDFKIKILWYVKDTVKKMKRQATDWKKKFAKHIPNKRLIARIYISCGTGV
jgi:hypothetical protein